MTSVELGFTPFPGKADGSTRPGNRCAPDSSAHRFMWVSLKGFRNGEEEVMAGRLTELERKLLEANMGRHTRFWGVIDEQTGTYSIKGTCRDCGDHGEFKTQQQADEFKAHHDGPNNECPHKKEVRW